MADYIKANGVDQVSKNDFALFIRMADNSDKMVSENSMKVLGECFTIMGDNLWTQLTDIPPKVQALLDERFKGGDAKAN